MEVFGPDGGRRFATPMDLLWHINLEEMLGDLTVTTFLILLAASVVDFLQGLALHKAA